MTKCPNNDDTYVLPVNIL